MSKLLKKTYCPSCQKHFEVDENVYFCEHCGGLLEDTGERVKVEKKVEIKKNTPKEEKTEVERKNNIKLLYGESNMRMMLEKKYTSLPYRLLSAISLILFFVAIYFLTQKMNETLVDEWSITTAFMQIDKQLYFLSQGTYNTVVLLLITSCFAEGLSLLGTAIRQLRLYKVVARKLNEEQKEIQYLEGLSTDKYNKINDECSVDLYYSKIRTSTRITSIFLLMIALGSMVVGVLCFLFLQGQYNEIVEVFIQKMRYEQFDKNSGIFYIGIALIVEVALYIMYLIATIVCSISSKKAKKQAEDLIKGVEGV